MSIKDFVSTKSPFLSKGVLGGGVAAAAGVAQIVGYQIAPGDVAELQDLISGVITSSAGILAIIGRWMASTRLSFKG